MRAKTRHILTWVSHRRGVHLCTLLDGRCSRQENSEVYLTGTMSQICADSGVTSTGSRTSRTDTSEPEIVVCGSRNPPASTIHSVCGWRILRDGWLFYMIHGHPPCKIHSVCVWSISHGGYVCVCVCVCVCMCVCMCVCHRNHLRQPLQLAPQPEAFPIVQGLQAHRSHRG